jgi:hypothetical protein
MILADAKAALIETARLQTRHKHYSHVNQVAKDCRAYVTGDGLDDMLQQFVRREDSEAFKQRTKITKHVIPAVSENICSAFNKVPRAHYQRILRYESETADAQRELDLDKLIAGFYGTSSLDDYLKTRLIELNKIDPNAWVVVEFDAFNPVIERAKPYPFEANSAEAINYKYTNNVLEYLIVLNTFSLDEKTGERYTIYAQDQTATLTQISEKQYRATYPGSLSPTDKNPIDLDGATAYKIREMVFIYQEYTPHGENRVPAYRVGYIRDMLTNGATFLPIYHAAIPYFQKIIKANSELDLTMCLTAYPQRLRYAPTCDEPDCYDGRNRVTNAVCSACNGTAVKNIPSSAQDEIVLRLPTDKADILSLDDLLSFKSPPTDIMRLQIEYLDAQVGNCKKAVFNADLFTQTQVANTATGQNIDLQNIYDTLYPFAVQYANIWQFLVTVSARFAQIDAGLIAKIVFPKDFKLSSLTDLLNNLEQVNRSEAGPAVRASIQMDIARIMYADNPLEMQMYLVKDRFNPLRGMSESERVVFINSPLVPEKTRVLAVNFETIFSQIEAQTPEFYFMNETKQREIVAAKTDEVYSMLQPRAPGLNI